MIGLLSVRMNNRPEFRVSADIPVRIWGMDEDGHPFFQNALATNLSNTGAQLNLVRHPLRVGEVIGIQYGDVKARFTIMWVKSSPAVGHGKVGVHILGEQQAPWENLADENPHTESSSQRDSNRRRFTRHKVQFPLEISFPDHSRAHMQCSATDMGGRGCYVESLVPLATATKVIVTFWIDSQKLVTHSVVRASDPGVGMGIEFISLEEEIQQRLQDYIERLDEGFSAAAAAAAGK